MKIVRSTKTNLKYLTENKRQMLEVILEEYTRVCNRYIEKFWSKPIACYALVKSVLDVTSWLSFRMCQCAAREALGMISAAKESGKEKAVMPIHHGKRMYLSSAMLTYEATGRAKGFDGWLKFTSIGSKIKMFLPIRKHRQFNKWDAMGKMNSAWIITPKYIQFSWTIETGIKQDTDRTLGVDTGINALASTSDGKQYGTDIKQCIETIKRRKHGSKGQKRAVARLKQRMGEVAKEVLSTCNAVVVEKLKNITKNTKKFPKRRLGKNVRRTIGRWNVRYWLNRLQQLSEENRVSFRSVPAYFTSVTCPSCGNTDRGNRNGTIFKCQNCNHTDNADVNAAKNIVLRFTTGKYGSCFKPVLQNSLD